MLVTIAITSTLKLSETSEQLRSTRSENENLEQSGERMHREVQTQRHEIDKLKKRLDKQEQKTKTLRERNKQLDNKNNRLRNKNSELESELQARAAEPDPEPVQTVQAQPATSCEAAIEQTWPAHLQSGAKTVLDHENGQHDPSAISAINHHPDGSTSRDFGCFQINNKSHAGFFASNDWSDPVANSRYARSIYESRGDWTAWYAVAGILW